MTFFFYFKDITMAVASNASCYGPSNLDSCKIAVYGANVPSIAQRIITLGNTTLVFSLHMYWTYSGCILQTN